MKSKNSSTSHQKNFFDSKTLSVRKSSQSSSSPNMYAYQKLELYCSQYKKLKTFVMSSKNEKQAQTKTMIHSANDLKRKRKTKFRHNLNYLHSFMALVFCTIVSMFWNSPFQLNVGVLGLSSSDTQLPSAIAMSTPDSPKTDKSRDLTEKLLNLDLGYNVLNNEMLRQGMGYSLETLDEDENTPIAEARIDNFNRHDFGEEWEDDFHVEDENLGESLPKPEHLGKVDLWIYVVLIFLLLFII